MKYSSNNPWATRFESMLDRAVIKQRALVTVPKLEGLRDLPTELACTQLENALKTVFYPTTQCVNILERFVGEAYAHCISTYSDEREFIGSVYAKQVPLPEFSPPILLTGLAGTGKSQIMKAFRRIQVENSQIIVGEEHSPFPLMGPWSVTVQARSTPKDILKALARTDGTPASLVDTCRKLAFRDGIPFLMADEFQFATGSGNANTRLAQMLFSLGYIGIPWTCLANYSLIKRLLNRPEEERQRLLSDIIILLPDHHESEDWIQTLKIQKSVSMEILTFDHVKDAADIHAYTAGRKRATVKLLVIAFRYEHSRGGTVGMSEINRAYHSQEFASYREESEILANQTIQNCPDKIRKDLWCPIPIPKSAATRFTDAVIQKRNEQVADSELRSALNKDEREALQQIERDIKKGKRQTAKVLPLRKKKPAPTAEDLKNNANWFKDQL